MSDEDKKLKDELDGLVCSLLQQNDGETLKSTLDLLGQIIRTSTTSMTSVPKPLKFLRIHFNSLKSAYLKVKDIHVRKLFADILSVLSLTIVGTSQATEKNECLNYCLSGNLTDVGSWGHEYVRQLETEIADEWVLFPEKEDQLLPLVKLIIKFDTAHHAEIQACDLLMEIDHLDLISEYLDTSNYSRVCMYLLSCASFVDDYEAKKIFQLVTTCYMKFKEYLRTLTIAIQLRNNELIENIFKSVEDLSVLKQLAFTLSRQQINIELDEGIKGKEDLQKILMNGHLSEFFHNFSRELDIMDPKTPEDVYKTWLEPVIFRSSVFGETTLDSARQNLASSFVNGFVNASFSTDKLMTTENANRWVHKNKEHGMLSACASLGLIYLWDVDAGLTPIDKYLYTSEDYIKAGALLALGIVNCGIRSECDPALALLSDYVTSSSQILRVGSILGLGLAYGGTNREDVLQIIFSAINCPQSNFEVLGLACVSCGLISAGTCSESVSTVILQRLFEIKDKPFMNSFYLKFMLLGIGLLYLGHKENTEVIAETMEVLDEPHKSLAHTILTMCAYAGTGDVLIIQELLYICCESYLTLEKEDAEVKENAKIQKKAFEVIFDKNKTKLVKNASVPHEDPKLNIKKPNLKPKPDIDDNLTEKKRADGNIPFLDNQSENAKESGNKPPCDLSSVQSAAVLAVACVAMGEEIGLEMSHRILGHLARYGNLKVRKAVPLAFALCSVSNPQLSIIDLLNKYSHDTDVDVAYNAIFSMGLVGAGTNNARLAMMLRQLAVFHSRHSVHLFMVRLAQGLTYLGKGTMSLNPFHTDRQIMSPVAVAGLLITLMAMLDCKNTILGKNHYLLYSLAAAMHVRWLVTLDENMNQIPVSVRIGQAVDTVGKAGCPKTIAGIRTHTTPVLLSVGERAELAADEYTSLSPIMEGFVVLRQT